MKKLFLSFGVFLPIITFAATTFPSSGIDLNASYATITYISVNDSLEVPCLGETLRNDVPQNFSFTKLGLTEAILAEDDPAIRDFGKWSDETNRCFQKAGTYSVQLFVFDRAGNSTESEEATFSVVSATPNEDESSFSIDGCRDKVANAEDVCELELLLLDEFKNPVTQDMGSVHIQITSTPSPLDDDANLVTKFPAGLRIEGEGLGNGHSYAWGSGTPLVLKLTANAPSIAKVATGITAPSGEDVVLSTVATHDTVFQVTRLGEIGFDGEVENNDVEFAGITAPLKFDVPVAIMPLFRQGESEKIKLNDPVEIYGVPELTKAIALDPVTTGIKNVSWNSFAEPTALAAYEADPESYESPWESLDKTISFGFAPEDAGVEADTLKELFAERQIVFVDTEDETFVVPQNISLTTTATYDMGGQTISYVAGAMGERLGEGAIASGVSTGDIVGFNDKTDYLNIGISVEGMVIGDHISAGDSMTATFLTEYQPIDIREKIVKNAYQLIRNASEVITTPGELSDEAWGKFEERDVVVVDLTGAKDTGLEPTLVLNNSPLPAGQKTLIVLNGNVLITGDLKYGDSAQDSFGLILLRDKSGPEPKLGNIFVNKDVKNLSGTFFADGSFFGTDISAVASPDALLASANIGARDNQLLLTGSLLSKNTIGGSRRIYGGSFFSPWGPGDLTLAKKYDLHEVRQYDASVDSGNCVAGSVSGCDGNDSSFVLRLDQKAIILPPPGFITK